MRVSIDKYFSTDKYFWSIVNILWKNYDDWIQNKIAVVLSSLFLLSFPNNFLYFVCIP